jgi:hypothetical protein
MSYFPFLDQFGYLIYKKYAAAAAAVSREISKK